MSGKRGKTERIGLVGPYDPSVKNLLRQTARRTYEFIEIESTEAYERLSGIDYVILRTLRLDGEAIESAPGLRFIQRWGVGYDTVDISAAGKRGIPVANTFGVNAVPVAEMAVLLTLAVFRNLIPLHQHIAAGRWERESYISKSFMVRGKTVGLVGLGNIGREAAAIFKGFGARVRYFDVNRLSRAEEACLELSFVPFDQLLETSDIVSLHLPLNEATRGLIGREAMRRMKPEAVLINTSRGGIIDETALCEALSEGRILGAGLDAMAQEPPEPTCPLLQMENVVLTPHMGGNTADNNIRMAEVCMENIARVGSGRPLDGRYVVNKKQLKAWGHPISWE